MPAITSKSPISMPTSANKKVRIKALRGSLLLPTPLAKNLWVTLSPDIACKIRGAPKMPPKADDKVAPQIPAMTRGDIQAIF